MFMYMHLQKFTYHMPPAHNSHMLFIHKYVSSISQTYIGSALSNNPITTLEYSPSFAALLEPDSVSA